MPDIQLVVVDGPMAGTEFDIAGSAVIGRDPSSGIVLNDPEASRRHASLSAEDDGLTVEDLGSTNGTYVAGERISASRRVANGERIRIGTSVMEVRVAAPEPAAPADDPQATRIGGMAVPDAPPAPEPEPEAPAAYEPPAPPPPPPPAEPEPQYEEPAPEPEPAAYAAPEPEPEPEPEPAAYEPPPPPPADDATEMRPTPGGFDEPPPADDATEMRPIPGGFDEPPPDDSATEMRPIPTGFDAPGDTAPPPPPGGGFEPGAPPPAPGPPTEPHYAEGPQASAPPPPPPPGGYAGDPGPPPPPPPPPPGYAQPGAPPQHGPPGYQPGPMVQPGGFAPQGPMPPRKSEIEWLLCIFVPFYSLYFIHRSSKEMEAWSNGRIPYNPTSTLLALTLGAFILVPPFVAIASYCGRIREARRMAGLPQDVGFWGFIGRAFLLSYAYKWVQDKLNETGTRPPQY